MADQSFSKLTEQFRILAQQQRWQQYIEQFCIKGMQWLLNIELMRIRNHLEPLTEEQISQYNSVRLHFLSALCSGTLTVENAQLWYETFLKENDFDGAAAVVGSIIVKLFSEITVPVDAISLWLARTEDIVQNCSESSFLIRAFIETARLFIKLVFVENQEEVKRCFETQMAFSEIAQSSSLRVLAATGYCYHLLFIADIQQIDFIMYDIHPLCKPDYISKTVFDFYRMTHGLVAAVQGKFKAAVDILEKTVYDEEFTVTPAVLWFLGFGNLTLAYSFAKEYSKAEQIAQKMHERIVIDNTHFMHGYAHFCKGVTYLMSNNASAAYMYGKQAYERAIRDRFSIGTILPVLLIGLSLSDLKKMDDALHYLISWIDILIKHGYYLYAATASLEVASIYIEKDNHVEALIFFNKAKEYIPGKGFFPILFRSSDRFMKLEKTLGKKALHQGNTIENGFPLIQITTFGQFSIAIQGKTISDRKWLGSRTMSLLKAIVVNGCSNVSNDKLITILWPDSDRNSGMRNLKVGLLRLRRLVDTVLDQRSGSWIHVHNGQVNLNRAMCEVDAETFHDRLKLAMRLDTDIDAFKAALDLYTEDFLVEDTFEEWIIHHREALRKEYIKGVSRFSELCLKLNKPEICIEYLEKAIQRERHHEILFAHIMRSYIGMGYPSRAVKVFNDAKKILKNEFGVNPGPVLIEIVRQARNEVS
ncbi:MAG: hypothetical protein JW795_17015 [Chitinivibrionales bacterium]|nr:hypothetical protein [Chitinivibrionales bacterium]